MNAEQAAAELMDGSSSSEPTTSAPHYYTYNLRKISEKINVAKLGRATPEELSELAKRIVAGREKIAKARSEKLFPEKEIKAADRKLAELDDQLTEKMVGEAQLYALSMAYSIGRDFLTTLHRTAEAATLTFHVPVAGVSFTLALDGPDDEPDQPPF